MGDVARIYRAHAGFEAARSLPSQSLHGHSFKVVACSNQPSIQSELEQVLAQFNYTHLNDITPATSDLGLAMRLIEALKNMTALHLQSAPDRGVYIDTDGQSRVWLSSRFEAAHFLPNVPEDHKCGRLHGHSFGVRLHALSSLPIKTLESHWLNLKAVLNNAFLNKLDGLSNPTSEQLAQWIWQVLDVPELVQVTVLETHSAGCSFNGVDHQIWKQQNAESALYLPKQGTPTGHSYIIRLYLSGELDPIMGWAVDYSDVKALFKPIYNLIDHHDLNTTLGLANTEEVSALDLAEWIRKELSPTLPQLSAVEVFESDCKSVSLAWHQAPRKSHIPFY